MMKRGFKIKVAVIVSILCTQSSIAQQAITKNNKDTLMEKTLDAVVVKSQLRASDACWLPDIKGINIYAGKRTNTVNFKDNTTGVELNLGRTALARIPGLTMWEMDGAGTQLNIGSRGTDPHRSIEMNMRQNDYNTNSDIFGYPENHYTVPMQAIEEVELVRGSAALQFGPQFGGMMNYKIKEGDSTKSLAVESKQTAGSNNYFNSFNAVGGTKGKLNYYAFYDNRHGDGWRDNAKFNYHSYYIHLAYQVNKRINIAAEFSRMDYVQQIAGGLTDEQFKTNSKQSQRSRNYFQPVINIPALIFKYEITPNTRLQITSNAIFGERNSVQFINAGNIRDSINTSIGTYNPRQVDRDYYKGFTTEARLLHLFNVGKISSVLSGGVRYFTELTRRKQKGTGTTASDFDLSVIKPYGTDLHLTTNNIAVFAENVFQLTPALSVTPGIRYELIKTNLAGVINNAADNIAYRSSRNFPLLGAGLQYKINSSSQFYGNISQAYRPYLYANVTPADRLDKIDPSLKDSKGYDIDLGYRGHYKNIAQFELNAFYLFYGNKIGLISQTNGTGEHFLFTTNIGNSVTKGVEAFGELSLMKLINAGKVNSDIRIFNSLAYNDARYVSGVINQSGVNKKIAGNYVENAPVWVNKSGIKLSYKKLSLDVQYSYTSKTYNDAFNTESSSNGVIGAIPAYHVWDCSANWQFSKQFSLSASMNNFTGEKYFNRRITFYPGPGILPADGRTFNISLSAKF
jgi:Fe(3+) dicitrate transport protein